jgi:hypothetical protein
MMIEREKICNKPPIIITIIYVIKSTRQDVERKHFSKDVSRFSTDTAFNIFLFWSNNNTFLVSKKRVWYTSLARVVCDG